MIGLVYCRGYIGLPRQIPPNSVTPDATSTISIGHNNAQNTSLVSVCGPLHAPRTAIPSDPQNNIGREKDKRIISPPSRRISDVE
jgi:hypothetical protein